MAKLAFISGPIQGVEGKQNYREKMRRILVKHGYEVIDPWLRERVVYRAPSASQANQAPPRDFIKRDLEDIDRCDVLVAYMPRLSAGTCMELFYAKLKGKKTIVVCRLRNPSPWIIEHSDVIVRNFRELGKFLREDCFH
ncbi:MAG: nucleoside 2-deoxyribosyltransferase [Candidatus Bathyarchaeota archaeon]|nr:nucleoside 2-deoxyribosyltransferase [Candidatus Bathyarchaeota archaeon]